MYPEAPPGVRGFYVGIKAVEIAREVCHGGWLSQLRARLVLYGEERDHAARLSRCRIPTRRATS